MSPPDTTMRDPDTARVTLDRPSDYLHAEHTLRSWFFTTDHKRIALLYLASITVLLRVGRDRRGLVRLSLVVPNGAIFTNDTYNKAVHHARRGDGVVLPGPVDPGDARQLPAAAHDRGAATWPSRG